MLRFLLASVTLAVLTHHAYATPDPDRVKAALESQVNTRGFVRIDDRNLYTAQAGNVCRVVPLQDGAPYELQAAGLPVDACPQGDVLFLLTRAGLEEWNLATRTRVATHPTYIDAPAGPQRQPTALAAGRGKLVISHGRLGVAFFDLRTRKISSVLRLVTNQAPLESMATGVTIQADRAYVVMDNYSLVAPGNKPPFRGLVILDVEHESVVTALDGMDPGADSATSDEKSVIVSFGGIPIWTYAIRKLKGNKIPEPELRVFRFPVPGHPSGAAVLDGKYYHTCFSRSAPGGAFERISLSIDRRLFFPRID